jgi:hypothetical protein
LLSFLQTQCPTQDRSVARKFDVHRFCPATRAPKRCSPQGLYGSRFMPLRAGHSGKFSMACPISRSPARVCCAKTYFPAPQDRAIIVDFIAISKISSF